MDKNNTLRLIDLFCGCGGMSYGFASEGFDVAVGLDNWPDSLVTFERNHPHAKGIVLDLSDFNSADLRKRIGAVDVVVGGPPCQGFSISGKRNPGDPRNKLYQGFVKIVREFKPRAFILENVPNLVSMDGGMIRKSLIKDFVSLGYDVKYKILLASDYGVPQNRRRVVFVGIQGKNNFEFPEGTCKDQKTKITCFQALSDLPEGSLAEGTLNQQKPKSEYQVLMRKNGGKIFNHQITTHDKKTIETIALVPDGGNYKDLPKRLQGTRKVHIAWTRYSSKKPSLTIDTGHRHHFHYKYNRIPTVRESARLQSFPDDFIFCGTKTSQYKQVGNAVPPLMAKAIAKELKKAFI
ncbi:MAG: DNA cytosine methyltransferase [Patescibacteria group bacterium]|nr:DNA cytosine methyltransferase [Patescibacteria group bacterium]